jgi:hypothetical protein
LDVIIKKRGYHLSIFEESFFMQLLTRKLNRIALFSFALTTSTGVVLITTQSSPSFAFGFQEVSSGRIQLFDTTGDTVGSGNFGYTPFDGSFVQSTRGGAYYVAPGDPTSGLDILSSYAPPDSYSLVNRFSVTLNNVGGSPLTILNNPPPLTTTGQGFGNLFFFNPANADSMPPTVPEDTFLTVFPGDSRHPSGQVNTRPGQWFNCLPACGIAQRQVLRLSDDGTWSFEDMVPSGGSGGALKANLYQNSIPTPGSYFSTSGTFRMMAGNPVSMPEPTTVLGTLLATSAGLLAKQRLGKNTPIAPAKPRPPKDTA